MNYRTKRARYDRTRANRRNYVVVDAVPRIVDPLRVDFDRRAVTRLDRLRCAGNLRYVSNCRRCRENITNTITDAHLRALNPDRGGQQSCYRPCSFPAAARKSTDMVCVFDFGFSYNSLFKFHIIATGTRFQRQTIFVKLVGHFCCRFYRMRYDS